MNEKNMREALEKILLIADEFGGLVQKHISPIATKILTTQPAVPEGWKLVPVEPTDDMVQSGYDASWDGDVTDNQMFAGVYRAMLSAAPASVSLQSLSAEDLMQAALHASRKNLVAGTSNWAEFVLSYLESKT